MSSEQQENSINPSKNEQTSSNIIPRESTDLKNIEDFPKNSETEEAKHFPNKYFLTPMDVILLNKQMPPGLKFESEEEVLKSLEQANNPPRKPRSCARFTDASRKQKSKKIIYENSNYAEGSNFTKKMSAGNEGKSLPHNINNEMKKLKIKCDNVLSKIKSHPSANFFYSSRAPGCPALITIEKKNNNYEFKNYYDFSVEVRKLWGYFFQNFSNNPEIYQKTLKMVDHTEKILKEMETYEPEETQKNCKNLIKKVKTMQNEAAGLRHLQGLKEVEPPQKKNNSYNPDKQMTLDEKNALGNSIRSLNKEQLKGIIKILKEPGNNNDEKQKFFEFDIDKLPPKKLRELERYVQNCMEKGNNHQQTIIDNTQEKKKDNKYSASKQATITNSEVKQSHKEEELSDSDSEINSSSSLSSLDNR